MNYTHFHGTINLLLLRLDYHDYAGNHSICLLTPRRRSIYYLRIAYVIKFSAISISACWTRDSHKIPSLVKIMLRAGTLFINQTIASFKSVQPKTTCKFVMVIGGKQMGEAIARSRYGFKPTITPTTVNI